MANVNINFNNKDYLLSCDDGQEESLKKLVSFLDKKYTKLKDELGNIGENKLFLVTTIKILDDYFNLKQKVDLQKNRLNDISKKFLEMKSLAIKYKDNKDSEINNLNNEIDKFKATVEESNSLYESILDKTTKSLQDIIDKAESKSELQ
ncbi:MAG: cell division protein ZapA [Proteobacteria bacterium]|jgi:cell division protein ZapA|nr:cell division protein ZapA [Pseudomonadota bacterium]